MKKILNWFFGSFFRTIGRVIAFFTITLLIAYFVNKNGLLDNFNFSSLLLKVNASTLTSYSTYTGNTNDFTTCGGANTYSFTLGNPGVSGQNYWYRSAIGSVYDGKAYQMSFLFKSGLTAQKTYDIVVNFNSRDLTYRLNSSGINLFNGSDCSNMFGSDISLISFTNNATSSSNTNQLKFRIYANSIINYWGFTLSANNNPITSVNNFGVKSITIEEVDVSGNNQVIENNNNNTQNIIDNDKQNTQNIIDNINNQFETCRNSNNLIDNSYVSQVINGITFNVKDGVITTSGTATANAFFPVNLNQTYIIGETYSLSGCPSGGVYGSTYALYTDIGDQKVIDQGSGNTFVASGNTGTIYIVVRTGTNMNGKTFKPMLNIGSSVSSFEAPGKICKNKIDDTNDKLNDLNNSLNDSDISQSTGEASNFFNNFNTDTHGLTSVITAPLNAIQSLTSKTCNPLVLPIPFLNNKNLTLPCMRDIYDDFFGDFMDIYDVITLGIVSYWILVRIFNLVKDFKNPDHDEIEVMDL